LSAGRRSISDAAMTEWSPPHRTDYPATLTPNRKINQIPIAIRMIAKILRSSSRHHILHGVRSSAAATG
jgi:hypothetical protein